MVSREKARGAVTAGRVLRARRTTRCHSRPPLPRPSIFEYAVRSPAEAEANTLSPPPSPAGAPATRIADHFLAFLAVKQKQRQRDKLSRSQLPSPRWHSRSHMSRSLYSARRSRPNADLKAGPQP